VPTSDRRGFTLVETCIVIGVAAVLMVMGWPRIQRLLLQSSVRSARSAVIGSYQTGRMGALQSGKATTVWFSANRMWVTAKPRTTACAGCTYDTLGVIYDLNQRYGVTLTVTPDTFVYLNARGLGLSTNNATTVIALNRAGVRDTVRINQIGRVTK
jgi:prepilin-type N-terminal cleavage/methylation domain-containing protein